MRQLLASLLIASSLLLSACIGGDSIDSLELNSLPGGPGVRDFYSTMTDLEIEVAYEPGAEPNTGNTSRGHAYWSILEKNLVNAFAKRDIKPTVSVPKTLSAMRELPAQSKPSWTAQEILDLSYQYRKGGSSYTTGNFWIVFLNGSFHQNGAADPAIIGVQVAETTVIAIFKDTVRRMGNAKGSVSFAEQSTLVHEMGHALGLVDHGVPMVGDHLDREHGHHCTNPKCVMYWENEGTQNLTAFIQQVTNTGNVNLFGQECLNDMNSFKP